MRMIRPYDAEHCIRFDEEHAALVRAAARLDEPYVRDRLIRNRRTEYNRQSRDLA